MTTTDLHVDASLEILLGELMADEELLDSFLQDPARALRAGNAWALPLSESELQSLRALSDRLWEKLAQQLEARLRAN